MAVEIKHKKVTGRNITKADYEEPLVVTGTPGKILTFDQDGKAAEVDLPVGGAGGNGKSAYELALEEGFVGTKQEWIDSLKAPTPYELAVANGFNGTEAEWLLSLEGDPGSGVPTAGEAGQFITQDGETGEAEWTDLTWEDIVGDITLNTALTDRINALIAAAGGGTNTAPAVTTAPTISGTPTQGQTLTATAGVYTGSPTPTVTREWLRNGSAISGATGATYVLTADDVTTNITYRETATNSVSSVQSTSNSLGPVAASDGGGGTLSLVSNKTEPDIDIGFTTNGNFDIVIPDNAAGDLFIRIESDTAAPLTLSVGGVAGTLVPDTNGQAFRVSGPITAGTKTVNVTFAGDTVHLGVQWFTLNAAPSAVVGSSGGGAYSNAGAQPIADATIPANGLRIIAIGGEPPLTLSAGLTLLSERTAPSYYRLVQATANSGLSFTTSAGGFPFYISLLLTP